MQPEHFKLHHWRATHRLLADSIVHMLLLGVTNKRHLIFIANECATFAAKSQGTLFHLHLKVATDCLLVALEQDILDPAVIQGALSLDSHCQLLSQELRKVFQLLAYRLENTPNLAAQILEVLLTSGQTDMASGQPTAPFHDMFQKLIEAQDLEAAQSILNWLDSHGFLERSGELWPIAQKLQGDVHFFAGEFNRARICYGQVHAVFPEIVLERYAQTLLKLGERELACTILAHTVGQRPWRTNAVLKLYDLLQRHDHGLSTIRDTSILLYTYNNGRDLDHTLESLAASSASGCDVFVLVNGCTDTTGQVVAKWQSSGAYKSFEAIVLPINIGAPAARNWLLSLDKVLANPFIAYLDDDIALPRDWLERLYYGKTVFKNAGAWGAKVREHGTAYTLQQVDLNLYYPAREEQFIGFADLQSLSPDTGQFDYMRPTASVTGCCHLFRREVFSSVGDFDIRFAPSQYDDFDHSLRMIQANMKTIYTGHVTIEHHRVSGRAAAMSRSSSYNVLGNLKKLEGKYDEATRSSIVTTMNAELLADYLRKVAYLAQTLI